MPKPAFFQNISASTVFRLALVLAACAVNADVESETSASSARLTPAVRAVQQVMPSVVNISTERVVRVSDPFEPFFNRFFSPHIRFFTESIPLGSGIIVDEHGLVLTNYHVIQRASKILVRLFNNELHEATIVAYDVDNDLCLLQLTGNFDQEILKAVRFAVPGDLYLGETVITVGNPFGLEHSVARGVLSAKNRSLREGEVTFNDILQTDAAINPGNSGGPLINLDGELIGINLAIRRDAEGIGFAIPLSRIENMLSAWLVPSRFSDGYCGFTTETVVDGGLPRAVVSDVWDNSPAATAGLAVGDTIVKINGVSVRRACEVGKRLWRLQPGEEVRIESDRGRNMRIAVEGMSEDVLIRRRLGVQVQPLNRALRRALGLPPDLEGLAISEILSDSEFAKRRMRWGNMVRRGDIIVDVNGIRTSSVESLQQALQGLRSGARVPVVLVAVDTVGDQVSLSPIRVEVTLN